MDMVDLDLYDLRTINKAYI